MHWLMLSFCEKSGQTQSVYSDVLFAREICFQIPRGESEFSISRHVVDDGSPAATFCIVAPDNGMP